MTGRPSDFTQDIADRICAEISDGKSLRKVCKAEDLPAKSTVFRWLRENKTFQDQYARAVEERAECFAEDALEIADDDSDDVGFKEASDKDGEGAKPFIKIENIQRAKLRVDTRKWYASKLAPKKYGDKVTQEHSGPDGKPISMDMKVEVVLVPAKPTPAPEAPLGAASPG